MKTPLPSASAKRLGVVEIGSRGIRLLVADFFSSGAVFPVSTQTVDLSLSDARTQSTQDTRELLNTMHQAVKQLKTRASAAGAIQVSAFGTESVRILSQDQKYKNNPLFKK